MSIKNLISIILVCIFLFSTFASIGHCEQADVLDITVEEAWELLSSTSNGIQLPIDVRTDAEWVSKRIDTPFPEYARQFEKNDIINEQSYQEFLELYDGNDVIIYCKSGGRSSTSANILVSRGFNGTVYNVLGGITDWESAGLPIKNGNDMPEKPQIPEGSEICILGSSYDFSSLSSDINEDVIRLGWDWDSDEYIDDWTEYQPSGSTFEQSHIWNMAGNFELQVISEDIVGGQSSFSDPLNILVDTPPIVTNFEGPHDGKIEEICEFIVSGTDADDDLISYQIIWGDGTEDELIGPFSSGEETTITHTWLEKGSYTIQVIAIDEHNIESDVLTHSVNMPKTKYFFSMFPILEYFINLFHMYF